MQKLRAQHTFLTCIVLAAVSVVYVLMAAALLRVQHANIIFTESEIRGLGEYAPLADFYIELGLSSQTQMGLPHDVVDLDSHLTARLQSAASVSRADEMKVLRDFMRDIGDRSNMILDPELPSYYAATLLINEMPSFVDLLSVQDTNATNLGDKNISYRLDALRQAATSVCKSSHVDCQYLIQKVSALERLLPQQASSYLKDEQKKEIIEAIQSVTQSTEHVLRSILSRRLDNQINHWNWSCAGIACLYVALVFLVMFSIRNYVSQREIKLAREREKLLTELARKNDELEKFAYAAAHDLKEPVRTMRCYATLLRDELVAHVRTEAEEYIGFIEGAAKRAEQMINDLMGYSKVSEEPLVWENCDSAKEVAAVIGDLHLLMEIAKPTIEIAPLPMIQTVPSMFRRVVANALDNAIKYRRPDVPLKLSVQADHRDDFWVFTIEDNGIGIEPEHVETVFEPFRRLKRIPTAEGQGIGLTSCRKIVERLGGKIWLESEFGCGTRVCFSLPAGRNMP